MQPKVDYVLEVKVSSWNYLNNPQNLHGCSITMNSIVQCSVFILLCFTNLAQGNRKGFIIKLGCEKKMAVLFYLSAQCDRGSIRLTGGPNKFEGRVELCMDGRWGQVCAMDGLDSMLRLYVVSWDTALAIVS